MSTQDGGDNQGDGDLAPEHIEVDNTEIDSALGDDISTSSTSITSSMFKYEWRHGRRYHNQSIGQYSFPNDNPEQDRLDMIHHVFYRTLNDRLFLAPIKPDGLNILDLGTGTGSWAIDMGDLYPGSKIVANDLSPIQPAWAPPNVHFYIDNIEEPWAEPEKYDFIHCRYMAGAVLAWPVLVSQIFENLAPGGWVEFQESRNVLYSQDNSFTPENPMNQMMQLLIKACDQIGRSMDPAPNFKRWAQAAGFEQVKEQRFPLPIGAWPRDPRLKEIGTMMSVNFHEGVAAFTAVPLRDILGMPQDEVEALNNSVRKACYDKDVHALFDFLVVTARKPLTAN